MVFGRDEIAGRWTDASIHRRSRHRPQRPLSRLRDRPSNLNTIPGRLGTTPKGHWRASCRRPRRNLPSRWRQLATNDSTGEIRLWSLDSKSKEPVRVLDGGGLRGLVFDDSGDLLAAFGRVGSTATVRLWNLKGPVDAEPTILKREDSLGVLINGAAFDPSGRWLATGHAFSVALWPVGNRLPTR